MDRDAESLFAEALALHRGNRLDEATARYRAVLARVPGHAQALHHLGIVALQRGDATTALQFLTKAVGIADAPAAMYANRANALLALERTAEALECYDAAIRVEPGLAPLYVDRGNVLLTLGRPEQALQDFERALELRPRDGNAWNGRGNALLELRRPADALAAFAQALDALPGWGVAAVNCALACAKLGRQEAALDYVLRAHGLGHMTAQSHLLAGNALADLGRHDAAIDAFDLAIVQNPRLVRAHQNRAAAAFALHRVEVALGDIERAILIQSETPDPLVDVVDLALTRLNILKALKRHEEVLAGYERLLLAAPDHPFVRGFVFQERQAVCDWRDFDETVRALIAAVDGGAVDRPFAFIAVTDCPAAQLRCARSYATSRVAAATRLWTPTPRRAPGPLRIAYLSGDFYLHAMGRMLAGMFESHDRSRFEIHGISSGPDDGSELRGRLRRAFDHFVDVRHMSDHEVAAWLRRHAIDIAVDLSGYTDGCRPGVLAVRPAALQVSYLGYPGTLGADWMDYLIADSTIIPEASRTHYSEAVIWMPQCYQVNDSARPHPDTPPARSALGLPETGFVFCCFNAPYKLTPPVFDAWLNILRSCPGSVLWLIHDRPTTTERLRARAGSKGVDPGRLIFATRTEPVEYLARLSVADLFLDTLPYSGHGTVSDALWMGLPVLTCTGRSFASRVGASLVTAVGLPELVTHELAVYTRRAIELAHSPQWLGGLRATLRNARHEARLFDSSLFCRDLESAFNMMWERHENGQPPAHFSVAPQP